MSCLQVHQYLFKNITESNCCSVYTFNIQAFRAKIVEREKTGEGEKKETSGTKKANVNM